MTKATIEDVVSKLTELLVQSELITEDEGKEMKENNYEGASEFLEKKLAESRK